MHIRIEGLKAHDHDLDLPARALLTAPTGAGKTSIVQALMLVFLGYVPALGKTERAIAALMRERSITITLTLDDERTVTWSMVREAKGVLRTACRCSWLDPKTTPTEQAKVALQLLGTEEVDVAEALDIKTLLQAPAAKRAARIERLLAATDLDAGEKYERIARYTYQRIAGYDDAQMAAIDPPESWRDVLGPVVSSTQPAIAGAVAGVRDTLQSKIATTDLAATGAWIHGEQVRAQQAHLSKQKAQQEIEARTADLDDPDPAEVERLDAERARLDRDIGAADEREKAAKDRTETVERAQSDLDSARTIESTMRDAVRQIDEEDVAALTTELAQLKARLDVPEVLHAADPDTADIDAAMARVQAQLDQLDPPADHRETLAALKRDLAAIAAKITEAKDSPWRKVAVLAKRVETVAGSTTTKRPSVATRKLLDAAEELTQLARHHDGDLDLLHKQQKRLAAQQKKMETLVAREDVAREVYERARALLDRELASHTAARRAAIAAAEAAHVERVGVLQVARTADIARRDALQEQLDGRTTRKANADAALTKAQANVTAAAQRVEDLGGDPAAEPIDVEALKTQRAAVHAQLGTLHGILGARAELTRIAAEIEAEGAKRTAFAAIEHAVTRLRGEEISRAGGPVLDRMQAIFVAGGVSYTPFMRVKGGQCDIGWTTPDGARLVQALGGGEWTFFAAALCAAVVIERDAPVKLLLVEGAEPDDKWMRMLLNGLSDPTCQALDCVLVLRPAAFTPPGHLWECIAPGMPLQEAREA